MPKTRKHSTKVLAFTAVLTAIVSGTGGVLMEAYLNRPSPSISMLSVGFDAPVHAEHVKLADDDARLSNTAPWTETFERYEPFARVVELEVAIGRYVEEANELVSLLSNWVTNHISRPPDGKIPKNSVLTPEAILEHPFFSFPPAVACS